MPTTPAFVSLQFLALAGALALGLWLLLARAQEARSMARGVAATALVLSVLGAVGYSLSLSRRVASHMELVANVPHIGIPEAGFVTSNTCQSCHPDHYASWHSSFHRTMTQVAMPGAVLAPFQNITLQNRGRTYRLSREGDAFWTEMIDPDWEHELRRRGESADAVIDPPRMKKRIVMTTGSHRQQAYWVPSDKDRTLFLFPLTWLVADQRWVPREDVFLRPPDAGRAFDRWNTNCIECHSVAGEPNVDPHTGVVDTSVAELGISCEACHGPADEHVRFNQHPGRRWQNRYSSIADQTIVHPQRIDHRASSQICGQCHGMNVLKDEVHAAGRRYRAGDELTDVKMILRPFDTTVHEFEKRDWPRLAMHIQRQEHSFLDDRFWPDGMVRVSGREHNAMVESACYHVGEMSCLSCHSMHNPMSMEDMLAPGMESNHACLQCHQDIGVNIAAHTHHRHDSTGSDCMNCHMPHTTYGLLKAIRSHHIDSPHAHAPMDSGRPNACNLCHLDKPLSFAAEHLHRWYGQALPELKAEDREISAAVRWAITGDAGQRAIVAWHFGWEPAQRASGTQWMAPYMAHLLEDPYAAVRYVAGKSLQRLPRFEQFAYDFIAPPEKRRESRHAAINHWFTSRTLPAQRNWSSVLINDDGAPRGDVLASLAKQRNDRRIDLRE